MINSFFKDDETVSSKSTSVQSSVEVINEINSQESKTVPVDDSDSDLRLRLYKSKVNGIVSQALGKKPQDARPEPSNENQDEHENSAETELRLRMYKLKIREIVARALGKDLPPEQVEAPNEFENQEEIKTKSQVVITNKTVKEESTIMTVESTEVIKQSSN